MSAVKLTIDGREIEAAPGTTILEAARELGIDIPTLCYDPELPPNGACRICVVEVENAKSLVASCVTPVAPGMVVHTESERVINARRTNLSLLVANHPLVCITCEKNGECKLQDYCYRYGVSDSEFEGEFKELPLDNSNEFFIRDMNKCILCGICVGKCQEVVGAGAIDFTRRGFVTNVGPAFEDRIEDSSCVFCGLCIDSCPVGALTPKTGVGKGRPWQEEKIKTVCPYCSIGCSINLHRNNNILIDASAVGESPVNRGHLCARGKFGWDYLQGEDRLTTPLVKSNGVFVPVSWEEALGLIVDSIEVIKERYGTDALMGLSSPKLSNEESYLFQKLIRSLGSNNVDSLTRYCHAPRIDGLMKSFGSASMTGSIEDLAETGAVLIVGADPAQTHPVMSYRIREAVRRGAKLSIVNLRPVGLTDIADHYLPVKSESFTVLVNALAAVIIEEGLYDRAFIEERTEGFERFRQALEGYSIGQAAGLIGIDEDVLRSIAREYACAENAAVVAAPGTTDCPGDSDLVLSLANLAMLTGKIGRRGSGLFMPFGESNLQGCADMGVLPGVLTGYQPVEEKGVRDKFARIWGIPLPAGSGRTAEDLFYSEDNAGIKALYILGENPLACGLNGKEEAELLQNINFLVVQDIFMTETASLADVILPGAAPAEKTGTYTNTERRVQLSRQALNPPGDASPDWAVLAELAGWFGLEWDYESPEDIFMEIVALTPQYAGITYRRLAEGGLQWPCRSADDPGARVLFGESFDRGPGLFTVIQTGGKDAVPGGEKKACLPTRLAGCCQSLSESWLTRSKAVFLKKTAAGSSKVYTLPDSSCLPDSAGQK